MCAKKKNNGNGGELIVLDPAQYPALAADVAASIRENLAGEDVTPADLTRIRVPAGGGTKWTVPGIGDDGDELIPRLEGIMVHIALRRAFWPNPTPSGELPACISTDWRIGVGEPGGECEKCPNNQWASAIKGDGTHGRGKACKQMKLIFLLREGQILPDVVVVSPGSLMPVKNYQLKLSPLRLFEVITRLELIERKNKDGIKYAQIKPVMAGRLADDTAKKAMACAQSLRNVLEAAVVVAADVNGGSD